MPDSMASDQAKLREAFHLEMLRLYDEWRAIGYVANRYRQLVRGRGGYAAARHLLGRKGLSAGFERLRVKGKLSLTVEALVLQEPWRQLFTPGELDAARGRLNMAGHAQ